MKSTKFIGRSVTEMVNELYLEISLDIGIHKEFGYVPIGGEVLFGISDKVGGTCA